MEVTDTVTLPAVLVVDDDAPTRRLLRTTLSDDGYAITEAANSAEAFEHITRLHPPVVVLAINLGASGDDGLDLYQQVREHADLDGVQFIVLTGYDSDAPHSRAMSLGITSYFTNPIAPEAL